MTNADFMDEEQFVDEEPDFPTVFGIQLSPIVIAVLLALVGIGAAVFLFLNFLQPTLQKKGELEAQVQELEGQIQDPAEADRLIAEADERAAAAEQLQADVLALFADESSLETLLFDINERVKSANAQDETELAILSRFEVNEGASGVVNDGSLGEAVNGRLNRLVYNLEMEGNYRQTRSILRGIERLQPLLLIQDFKSEVQSVERTILLDENFEVVDIESPQPRLKTSFKIDALAPAEPLPPEAEEGGETPEGEGT
ncbi:MAG: hypothetical protein F6K16_29285 [Symploca sp. SIO2B6]|nr:hypothetical protein [Symploca sp. SIO2B6]